MVVVHEPAYEPVGEVVANRWYRSFLAVAAPLLVVGFLASAAADRLIFAAWALLAASAYGLALRWELPRRRIVVAWLVVIVSLAGFAWLAVRHAPELKLGVAAFLPAVEGAS